MLNAPPAPFFLQVLREHSRRLPLRVALFDFDGTLSLIRAGWQDVMIPFMVEVIQTETGTSEPEGELRALVTDFVVRLTGKQTIYQMIQLCEELRKRGAIPLDPVQYKRRYHERLERHIVARKEGLLTGRYRPEEFLVPGSVELLAMLRDAGVKLYLASGTDLPYVLEECELLGLRQYFEPHIYGAIDDYRRFSKRLIVREILKEIAGESLVGFGDGYVEIEEVKGVGGLAIGVASDERVRGGVSEWKVRRLSEAGAHALIPHYGDLDSLSAYLGLPRRR